MRYESPIYRPPSGADSLLTQATVGCPHNKCSFCMVYKKGPAYVVRPVKEICEDIIEAHKIYGDGALTLVPKVNTPLLHQMGKELFQPLSPNQVLIETRELLKNLECLTRLMSDHYTNYINLTGRLPEDKEKLSREIEQALKKDETRFRPFFIGTQ